MFRKGEVSTVLLLGIIALVGIVTVFSSNERRTTQTRAEFEGTSCNDDIHTTLNSSGSTTFNISCWGDLNKAYTFKVLWCPSKSTGATYCEDDPQVQIIEQVSGNTIPASISRTTNKTCGCVNWVVGARNAAGQEGIAGGAIFCSNACGQTNQPTQPPQNPTNPPNTPTNPPNNPTNPPQQNTIAPTNRPTSTNTPTPLKLPNGTQCSNSQRCQSGCCSNGLCNSASMCSAACRPGEFKCPGTNICVADQGQCATPTPTSSACRPGQFKCPGSNRCVDFQDQCATSCRPGEFKCPGTNTCVSDQGECRLTPTRTQVTLGVPPNTPTPGRVQVTLGVPPNTPTPNRTFIPFMGTTNAVPSDANTTFKVQAETTMKVCPANINNLRPDEVCVVKTW